MIEFPDVSFYQGDINWATMAANASNVIIRAGQGNYVDSKFDANWLNAKTAGLRRGCYWFYDDRYSPATQADAWAHRIYLDMPETVAWLDWESSYQGQYQGLGNVVACMQELEKLLAGVTIGMYTGYYWFRDNTNPTTHANQYNYLKTKPLWIAAYTASGGSEGILIPQPWTYPPELHQWGTPAIGSQYGVQSVEIDMNRVLKNESRYDSTIIPPDGGTMVGRVIVSALNIRAQPNSDNTTNPPIGQLKMGDIVEADTKVNGWWHLTKILRPDVVVALPATDCYSYEGSTAKYIEDVTPPPTDAPPKSVTVVDDDGITWTSTTFTKE